MASDKFDVGKLRVGLIPIRPLMLLADVYTRGAKKYSDDNWRKGIEWNRIYDALQRHALSWWAGEQVDPVDGQHHLASVIWAAMTLMEYEITHKELDNRVCQTEYLTTIKTQEYLPNENIKLSIPETTENKILKNV